MPAHLGQRRWRAEEIELEAVQQHTLGTTAFVLLSRLGLGSLEKRQCCTVPGAATREQRVRSLSQVPPKLNLNHRLVTTLASSSARSRARSRARGSLGVPAHPAPGCCCSSRLSRERGRSRSCVPENWVFIPDSTDLIPQPDWDKSPLRL